MWTPEAYLPHVFLFSHKVGNKSKSVLLGHVVEPADLALMTYTIASISHCDKFGAKGAHNELSRIVSAVCLFLDETGYRCPIR